MQNDSGAAARYYLPVDYEVNPVRRREEKEDVYWDERRVKLSHRWQYAVYRYARRLARQLDARRVLDLGCGPATKLNRLFAGMHLTGVDTEQAVAICQRLHPVGEYVSLNLDAKGVDVSKLTTQPDLVVCADVIEHMAHPEVLLRLCWEMSNKGAWVVLSTPCRARLAGPHARRPSNPEHVREWSKDELLRLVRQHGFDVKDERLVLPFRFGFDLMTAAYLFDRLSHRLPLTTTQVLTLVAG